MVPVKEAISTGAWLLFTANDESVRFRMRVVSFRKLDLSEVDGPENLEVRDQNGNWWLLGVEIVSLNKKTIRDSLVTDTIRLVDGDDFEFSITSDTHLWCFSDFSHTSGLHRFYGQDLIPKIKASGALAFFLPDDEVVYSLTMEDGLVREA